MKSRHTLQKEIVYDTLCSIDCHGTADQVYAALHGKYPNISKSTVYRILNGMGESGAILHIAVPNGADRFDHRTHKHGHIRCSSCGRVDDVILSEAVPLTRAVTDSSGYKITGCEILFTGLCPECTGKA